MTSALAAALEELDRSGASLELELVQNADFVALRRIEALPAPLSMESERQRLDLIGRLAAIPAFRAWRAIWTVRQQVAIAAVGTENRDTRARCGDKQAPRPQSLLTEPAMGRPVFARPAGAPQALTAIRGIDASLASKLRDMGIERYEQIAAWKAGDVRSVAAVLGLGRDISRRNWIEQAALLAQRTSDRADQPRSESTPRPAPATPQVLVASPKSTVRDLPPTAATTLPGSSGALVPRTPSALPAAAEMQRIVMRAARIAAAGARARLALEHDLGASDLPAVEDARPRTDDVPVGGDTEPPAVSIEWMPLPDLPLTRAARPPIARPAPAPAPAIVAREMPTPPAKPDPLLHIAGIDAQTAAGLFAAGVTRFAGLAAWTATERRDIAARLGIAPARISREGWIEQAAALAQGHETAYSRRVIAGELAALCPSPRLAPALPTAAAAADAEATNTVAVPGTTVHPAQAAGVAEADASGIARHENAEGAAQEDTRATGDRGRPASTPGVFRSQRSLARRLEAEVDDEFEAEPAEVVVEEATVTIIANRPASPKAGDPAREIEFMPPAKSPSRAIATVGATVAEEAQVEIVRRDVPAERADSRHIATTGEVRRFPSQGTPQGEDRQPIWIAEGRGDADGVLRRFLKALKRDA